MKYCKEIRVNKVELPFNKFGPEGFISGILDKQKLSDVIE